MNDIVIRPARRSDAAAIADLVNGFAAMGEMLFKTPDAIALMTDDFIVATDARGHVLACAGLREYSPSLAEVISVAVASNAHGRGLGRSVVARVEQLAERRGIRELFALTLQDGFFERMGYAVTERANYPEKVARDCLGCARRFACREICVSKVVAAGMAKAA